MVIHDQTNAFLSDEDILDNYHSRNLCLSFLKDKALKGLTKVC